MSHGLAKVALFDGPGRALRIEAFPVPPLQHGELLVRVSCCTLCGSDVHTWTGKRAVPTPTVLGHEIVGRIAAFGPETPTRDARGEPLRVGDRITWSLVASCGQCPTCLRNCPQKCERAIKYGHERFDPDYAFRGGLAEYCILVPGTTVVRLADEVSDALASPVNCATATVAAALRSVGELRGRTVLVQGAGMLGLTACAMARGRGAAAVIACDVEPQRCERAKGFGATHTAEADETKLAQVVAEVTAGRGVDCVLELAGAPAAIEAGTQQLRIGGSLVLVGTVFPTRDVSLSPELIVRRLLTLCGVHNYMPEDLLTAVQFLETSHRTYPLDTLVTQPLPLVDVQHGFELARRQPGTRVAIAP